MNKKCTVCGNVYDDRNHFCPVCGFTETQNQTSELSPSNIHPVQQPQNIQQPYNNQFNNTQPYPVQPSPVPETPPKKKHKVVFIVLGIVGGVIVIAIILIVILFFVIRNYIQDVIPKPLSELQEYYYADYDDASYDSEAYIQPVSTDAPDSSATTEATTEEQSDHSVGSPEFYAEDLNLLTIANENTESATFALTSGTGYLLNEASGCEQVPLTAGPEHIYTPVSDASASQFTLNRGIGIQSSLDDFCTAYAVNSSNSMLQVQKAEAVDYYYFSNVNNLNFQDADVLSLTIGWYHSDDSWTRMSPETIQDFWSQTTNYKECDTVLFYTVEIDESTNIRQIYIEYGTPDEFRHFHGFDAPITE